MTSLARLQSFLMLGAIGCRWCCRLFRAPNSSTARQKLFALDHNVKTVKYTALSCCGQRSIAGASSSHLQNLRKTIEARVGPLNTRPTVPSSEPLVIIISGPSGVGKDAVIKSLRNARSDLTFVVTATSRTLRPGEVDGKDYFFVSKQQFETWLQQGNLLEHAVVYGEYKGIPRSQVEQALQKGSDVVLRVDVQGAETIRTFMPESVCIFLVADSEAELVERLIARKTEPLESMLVRIQTARSECTHINSFDYVVVNREGRLEETVSAISAIIDAEKCKVSRRLQ